MNIGNKEIEVKELKYKDIIVLAELPKDEAAKKLLLAGTNLTEEEYNDLNIKQGIELQTLVNKANDLVSFQEPQSN